MINYTDLQHIDSTLTTIFGEPESMSLESISSALKPEPSTLTFIKNSKFYEQLGTLGEDQVFNQTGLVVEENFYQTIKETDLYQDIKKRFAWGATVKSVDVAMSDLSRLFYDQKYADLNYYVDGRQMGTAQVDPTAHIAQNVFIGSDVVIGKNVKIMPGVTILPKVVIEDGTILFPNVTVYPFSQIGKNCRLHAGAVIGADGFGYNFFESKHQKVWHLAGVIIGDDVEIGAGSMVDSGAFMTTRIGEGTKIDNLCQIAHNVQIGKHCVMAATSGLAGSAQLEDYCALGAGSGVAPGGKLKMGTQLAALTLVSENSSWPQKSILAGYPARPLNEWLKAQAKLRQLLKK